MYLAALSRSHQPHRGLIALRLRHSRGMVPPHSIEPHAPHPLIWRDPQLIE